MNQKLLISAALAACGLISQLKADNVIYITGSTAFRANVYNALANNTGGPGGGGVFDATTIDDIATYGNATAAKGTYMLFHGNIGGVATYIDCFWSGSEAGIAACAGVSGSTLNDGAPLAGVPATFLVPDKTVNPTVTSSSLPTSSQLNGAPTQADLAFADTSQAVSLTKPVGANKLTEYGICGIIPFTWVKGFVNQSDAAWTRLVNVSHPQLFELLGNPQTADFFNSGVPLGSGDFDHKVYLIGRNKGSGTRANYLLDTGYPIGNPVVQWAVNGTVGTSASGLFGLYYDSTIAGYNLTAIPHTAGDIDDPDNGYESGGDVAKALDNASSPSTGYTGPAGGFAITMGFLGVSDAGSVGAPTSAYWLTLNGVHESDGAIESGTYSAFGHEHLYGKNVPTNPAATSLQPILFEAIKFQFDNNDSPARSGNNTLADPDTLHSTGIYAFYMFADRSAQSDGPNYPVSGAASGAYTDYTHGTQ